MSDFKIRISSEGEATIDRLDQKLNKLDKTAVKTQTSSSKLATGIAAIATAAVAYVTIDKLVSSISSLAVSATSTAAKFEQFSAVLNTIEGSSLKAEQSMQWITDFAKTTPYELANVTESFVRLRSYGLEPTDGLLRTLGDTASAMGKDMMQAVEAIADAVVGENERLKEFGIRASVQGEQIAYSWTNASGQARQAIVENNSAIIESTLEAIFNSKYAGAMETQSKTWNGLISNMKDSWTIFQSSIMQEGGVFDYLKAIVTVVGEYMTNAFSAAQGGAKDFGLGVIETIKSVIIGLGATYDSLETFGDYFKVVGNLGKVAFYGLTTVFSYSAEGLVNAFQGAFNFVIDGINAIFAIIRDASFGAVDFGVVGYVDWTGGYAEQSRTQHTLLDQAKTDLANAYSDMLDTGAGASFADRFIADIDKAHEAIKNQVIGGDAKVDFGDDPTAFEEVPLVLEDFKAEIAEIEKIIKDLDKPTEYLGSNLSNINDTIIKDDGLHDGFNNIQDSFNNLIDTNDDLVDSYKDVQKATEKFIFQWEKTFIGSIQSNMSSLEKVFSSTDGATSKSYQQALIEAIDAQNALIANPLDVAIGTRYESAYGTLIDSAMEYLTPSNFTSTSDVTFAQARVGIELGDMRDTAFKAYDVQEAMLDALNVMNAAFADGILTDAERADITNVADKVNAKNQDLLRDNTILGKDGTINSLYKGEAISASVNTISGYATDTTVNGLYKGEDINAQVNTISGYATNSALTGTNSVSSFIDSLKTSIESGISIDSLLNATTLAATATGLKTDQISNVKTATDTTNTNLSNVYGALGAGSSGGVGIDNLRVKSTQTVIAYTGQTLSNFGGVYTVSGNATGAMLLQAEGTNYTYFNKGGYTGDGGTMQEAGVVHRGEFVIDKQNTAKLGLNQNMGDVFSGMLKEMRNMREENRDMRNIMMRIAADNSKILSVDRAMLSQMAS